MNQIVVNPLNRSHHDGAGGFREQICALYYTGIWSDAQGVAWAKFIKTLFHVCSPGSASLDPKNPGADTLAAWQAMDELIENEDVRGFFHTHPPGASEFSQKDLKLQVGVAKANGSVPIWHVVQAAGEPLMKAICLNMVGGQVFLYNLGEFDHDPSDPIILLPLPQKVEHHKGVTVLDLT